MKSYYIYILTNKYKNVIYVGVTNDLERRIYEHKNKLIDGFSKKYNLTQLAYMEEYQNIEEAITREKQIKGWDRNKKNKLVESINVEWKDLSADWYSSDGDSSLRSE